MSRPRGFSRGGGRGGGGRGGFRRDTGPPDQVLEVGSFVHAVEEEMLCCSVLPDKIPSFNAPIYLQNKSVIGLVDEILGPINEVYFSIKVGEGMVANSFKKGDKVYIGGDRLIPIERFLPKPKITGGVTKRGRGARGVAGAARGGRGRGFPRGGPGRGRGASRGGFSSDRGRGRGGFGSNRGGARGWGGRGRGS